MSGAARQEVGHEVWLEMNHSKKEMHATLSLDFVHSMYLSVHINAHMHINESSHKKFSYKSFSGIEDLDKQNLSIYRTSISLAHAATFM